MVTGLLGNELSVWQFIKTLPSRHLINRILPENHQTWSTTHFQVWDHLVRAYNAWETISCSVPHLVPNLILLVGEFLPFFQEWIGLKLGPWCMKRSNLYEYSVLNDLADAGVANVAQVDSRHLRISSNSHYLNLAIIRFGGSRRPQGRDFRPNNKEMINIRYRINCTIFDKPLNHHHRHKHIRTPWNLLCNSILDQTRPLFQKKLEEGDHRQTRWGTSFAPKTSSYTIEMGWFLPTPLDKYYIEDIPHLEYINIAF